MKTVKPLTSPVEVDEVIDHQPHAFGLGAGHQGARELARHAEDAIGLQAGGRAARHHEVHCKERGAGVKFGRENGRGSVVLEAQEIGRRPRAARDRGVASLVREGAATAAVFGFVVRAPDPAIWIVSPLSARDTSGQAVGASPQRKPLPARNPNVSFELSADAVGPSNAPSAMTSVAMTMRRRNMVSPNLSSVAVAPVAPLASPQ